VNVSHCIPMYPIVSHCIPLYPDVSHCIPLYPIVSRCIPLYPDFAFTASKVILGVFGGTRDNVPMALYRVSQDAETVSGMRDGFDENLTGIGRLGNNGKGTHRAYMEGMLGEHNQAEKLGYMAVFTDEALYMSDRSGPGPKQELSNANGCKIIMFDDQDTSKPLNSSVVRTLSTTTGSITAHGKNEKSQAWKPLALLNIFTNDEHQYHPKFGRADHKRQSVMIYPLTFWAPDDPNYEPDNPNHRLIDASIRSNISTHFPEIMLWWRCLAGVSRLVQPRASYLTPRPPEVRDEAIRLNPMAAIMGTAYALTKRFIKDKLVRVSADTNTARGECAASAVEIEKALLDFAADRGQHLLPAEAKAELQKALVHAPKTVKIAGTSIRGGYKAERSGGFSAFLKFATVS
jgi:hypothetical protein